MRVPRFFARGRDLDSLRKLHSTDGKSGTQIQLAEEDLIKQLRVVLRLQPGNRLLILDDNATIYELEILRLEKGSADCIFCSATPGQKPWQQVVQIGLALIKADRFEWCIEKLCEVGVTKIAPLSTRNCVVKLNDSKDAKGETWLDAKQLRWQSIVREASEQCERATLPEVLKPQEFEKFLCNAYESPTKDLRFICAERSETAPLVTALNDQICKSGSTGISGINSISLLVGPEGGFTENELSSAQEQGWLPVTLGPRILRSETAAIVAMAQVASVLDIAK